MSGKPPGVAIDCPFCRSGTRTVAARQVAAVENVETMCGRVNLPASITGYDLACGHFVDAAGYELRSARRRGREVFWLASLPGSGT